MHGRFQEEDTVNNGKVSSNVYDEVDLFFDGKTGNELSTLAPGSSREKP
jgi:hypothetical protein